MRNTTRHLRIVIGLIATTACGGGTTSPSLGPPVIAAVNGATLPSGPTGSTVVIEGQNFGPTQGSSAVLFSNGAGGTVAATIASPSDWTGTFIVTTVPGGAATGNVVVETPAGTSAPVVFTLTQNAAFSPSTISWTATTPLPMPLSGLAAAYAELRGAATARVVYAVGGAGTNLAPVSSVSFSPVGNTGTLGAWTQSTALPAPVAFAALAVATPANSRISAAGYLYVLGGATDAGGTPTTNVSRGTLAADGSVTAWTADTPLPAPLHSLRAVVFHGDLYLVGGSSAGNVPVASVYRARIGSTGSLGAWQTLASLPSRRSYFGLSQLGGYLYAFGGDSGTVAPNGASDASPTALDEVAYAKIDLRTGNLTAAGWSMNVARLKKQVSKETTVIAGGNALVTGGLYNGDRNGSTEESYAQLNPDGSTGSFNGATGTNTIQALGGGNLFNHAAVGYVDGRGIFHVLVAGGDDVNAPGTKHAGVYFY